MYITFKHYSNIERFKQTDWFADALIAWFVFPI